MENAGRDATSAVRTSGSARPFSGRLAPAALVAGAAVTPLVAAGAAHSDVASAALALAVILTGAKIGGHLVTRAGQPAVLGELIVGVLLGNLHLLGLDWLEWIESSPSIDLLAELGVVILLFEVGLESTVRDMMKVGVPSTLVAVLGVVAPFALGWGVGAIVLPEAGPYAHAFLGAALTATSVGITARVLRDLGRSQSGEARVILGAAVVDDVLGLVILAVVGGVIQGADQGRALSYGAVGAVILKAALFLFGSLALGVWLSPRLFGIASRLRGAGVLLATALVFCFVLATIASMVGLAPIVGAYAAGLILEHAHFKDFEVRGERKLEDLVQPISAFLVPVFFVLMGMRVDLATFGRSEVLSLAGLLTVAAVLGKQACALGAIGGKLDRLSIGIGMIPRGEVGLIFANIGLTLTVQGQRVLDEGTFSAVVIMVIVTTMATPPALRWSLMRKEGRGRGAAAPAAGA